ncbi:helix-turn-helix domain-containing protein [Pseudofrankia sp. DC12]|uniref:TetR/AcrR family transcriptional regulator n=1 Tax=Pseudofrankia sp. DC12 TaxID=683315 RepID=UPI001E33AEB6|nr:helix-turn-helix domain-containing protein [Pseudofrankia sp. DC12]
MTGQTTTAARAGRPRHRPQSASAVPARAQILDAAAALFTEHGFAATSTRMIADKVGIRQASLYYHFATKDELLVELLSTSVRPSLDVVERIGTLASQVSAAAALYAVAVADVRTLVTAPHNIGTLYLLPEAQGDVFAPFRAERQELQDAYGRLGTAAATAAVAATLSPAQLGELLIQLVEVVIQIRRTREPTGADGTAIAASCLRLCGLDALTVDAAATEARTLLASLG